MKRVSKQEVKKLLQLIEVSNNIFITGHIRPDSDVVGSALALFLAIRKLYSKKNIDIYFYDEVPYWLRFLPAFEKIKITKEIKKNYELGIILECSDISRTGGIINGLKNVKFVNIDHHYTNHLDFSSYLNIIKPEYASCAEIIFDIFKLAKIEINKNIAMCLYSGLVTDTGMFQWSNTNEHSFYTAMNLVSCGVEPYKIYKNLYAQKSYNGMLLLSKVLSTLELIKIRNYTIATMFMTKKMLSSTKANYQDAEDFINFPMTINGVSVAIFFKEEDINTTKVSFRSDFVDVEKIARRWGGGGHKYASGVTVYKNLKDVKSIVIKYLKETL